MTVEEMIRKNEEFKKKGLLLSEEDLFNRLMLRDTMITEVSNIKWKYLEDKIELDKDKAKRILELKTITDDKGKGLTEKAIEGNIKIEFADRELELITQKTISDLLQEKAESIIEYVNIVKLQKKSNQY